MNIIKKYGIDENYVIETASEKLNIFENANAATKVAIAKRCIIDNEAKDLALETLNVTLDETLTELDQANKKVNHFSKIINDSSIVDQQKLNLFNSDPVNYTDLTPNNVTLAKQKEERLKRNYLMIKQKKITGKN